MGSVNSSLAELLNNPLLLKLASPEYIKLDDLAFWHELLVFKPSFSGYGDVGEMHLLEEKTAELQHQLVRHSLHASSGGNLGVLFVVTHKLLAQYIEKIRKEKVTRTENTSSNSADETSILTTRLGNALLILRCVVKLALEHMTSLIAAQSLMSDSAQGGNTRTRGDFLLRLLYFKEDSSPTPPSDNYQTEVVATDAEVEQKVERMRKESLTRVEEFLELLVVLLAEVTVNDVTYQVHLEAMNTLLTLFSDVLYRPKTEDVLPLALKLCISGRPAQHGEKLVENLLDNFMAQRPAPKHILSSWFKSSMLYDATAYVASSLWSVLTLGQGTGAAPNEASSGGMAQGPLLANQSCLLLLVLCNHCTSANQNNPYRGALFDYPDKKIRREVDVAQSGKKKNFRTKEEAEKEREMDRVSRQSVQLQRLLQTLSETMAQSEQSVLVFYLLYHRNPHVRSFFVQPPQTLAGGAAATVVLRDDLWDKLTLPLLQILHQHGHDHSHRVYMALILLLLLTEDDEFNTRVHDIMLKKPPIWYTELAEKTSSSISLGSVLVLLLVQTIQGHITQIHDKYLHTNCLATLANMSSRISKLHPVVCRKLVNLLHLLDRRHSRLVEKLRTVTTAEGGDATSSQSLHNTDQLVERMNEEMSGVEEMSRMLVEIINSTLVHCLHTNPHLVYTLLSQRESTVLPLMERQPACVDLVRNVDSILAFFFTKITKEIQGDPTEHQVMEVIRSHSGNVSRQQGFKRFPELRFKYVEEESPEDFFIPYVWSLVFQQAALHFNPAKIELFLWPGGHQQQSNKDQTSKPNTTQVDSALLEVEPSPATVLT